MGSGGSGLKGWSLSVVLGVLVGWQEGAWWSFSVLHYGIVDFRSGEVVCGFIGLWVGEVLLGVLNMEWDIFSALEMDRELLGM